MSDSGLGRFRPGQFSADDQGSFRDERFGEDVWDDASRGKNKKNKQNQWQNPWADNNGGSNMGGNQWTDGGSNNGGNQEPVRTFLITLRPFFVISEPENPTREGAPYFLYTSA